MRPLVIIESPYAGDVERNLKYARACMRDSIQCGERPLALHLLYPQEGILDDKDPEERLMGIELGYEFWTPDCLVAFYMDLEMSRGMLKAFNRAKFFGFRWEKRFLAKLD